MLLVFVNGSIRARGEKLKAAGASHGEFLNQVGDEITVGRHGIRVRSGAIYNGALEA